MVETSGLEPLTPCMSSKYSNQLSYASKYRKKRSASFAPIYFITIKDFCQELKTLFVKYFSQSYFYISQRFTPRAELLTITALCDNI